MVKSDFSTFIFTHKDFELPSIRGNFKIVTLGNSTLLHNYEVPILSDAHGEHISEKNSTYCELTGIYWLFKNAEIGDNQIINLAHYRRYLKINDPSKGTTLKIIKSLKCDEVDFLVPKRVRNYIRYKQIPIPLSLEQSYKLYHVKEDWEIMERILIKKHPKQIDTINKVSNRHYMFAYNIFMCKGNKFKDYCSWLFEILSLIEMEVKISNYPYQKRVFGFLSERLFNYYLELNDFKIKEIDTIFYDYNRA